MKVGFGGSSTYDIIWYNKYGQKNKYGDYHLGIGPVKSDTIRELPNADFIAHEDGERLVRILFTTQEFVTNTIYTLGLPENKIKEIRLAAVKYYLNKSLE